MKLEGITLNLEDNVLTLEDIALQLQKYTSKVLLVRNGSELEILDDVAEIQPLSKWIHVSTEKSEAGTSYTVRQVSDDTGLDDESFDEEDDDITVVFREDAFQALTKIKVKAKKTK